MLPAVTGLPIARSGGRRLRSRVGVYEVRVVGSNVGAWNVARGYVGSRVNVHM